MIIIQYAVFSRRETEGLFFKYQDGIWQLFSVFFFSVAKIVNILHFLIKF